MLSILIKFKPLLSKSMTGNFSMKISAVREYCDSRAWGQKDVLLRSATLKKQKHLNLFETGPVKIKI